LSFRLKTILGIALIETFLLVILVLSALSFLSESNEKQLLRHAQTTSSLFANATKNAVLATDLATLDSFTNEIITNDNVVYVRIIANGITLAEAGSQHALSSQRTTDDELKHVEDGIFDVTAEITENGIIFGEIQMGLSISDFERVFTEAKRWTVGIAGLEVVLVAIFSFILGTYLTGQLKRLKEGSKIIERAGPGHQITINGNDEIAGVARAFNTMSLSLSNSYSNLEQSLMKQQELLILANHNEAKTQAILSSLLDAMVIIDIDGLIRDFNKVAETTFGWTRDELLGKPMADHIIPASLRSAHQKGMQHYHETGEGPALNKRLELKALHKNGHEFPIEIYMSAIETDKGPLFTAFIRDISENQAAQTELRLAAKAFQTTEAMLITDANVNIIRSNTAFTRITGYSEEEVIGLNPKDFLKSGLHDDAFYRSMWSSITDNGEWTGEIFNKRKNGEIFPEYLTISTVSDANEKVTHYIAHFTDISEQKANEKRLREARTQAEAASEAKGRFLATMSHEIRTPLNAVIGVFDLLKDSKLTPKQLELTKLGKISGNQLLSIINDILDFSKMEAGKLELKNTSFDLHNLLHTSLELLQPEAEIKGLEISLKIDTKVPRYAKGDPGRIRQVLVNLINNAIKFTPSGCITVHTNASTETDKHFNLQCEVEDTGIGVSSEFSEMLFDEFTMADNTHARMQEGTGLGLAICKQLVTLMQGDISVQNKPVHGSIFSFHVLMESTDHANHETDNTDTLATAIGKRGVHLLLAEDNPANQMIIRSILEHSGIKLDAVSNGREALEAIQQTDYDLVLMDISMPIMDGIAATKAIRNLPGFLSNIPIIALTAHAMQSDKKRFLQAGMNAHLTKPIEKHLVLECIAKYVLSPSTSDVIEKKVEAPHTGDTTDSTLSTNKNLDLLVDENVLRQLAKDTSPKILPELLLLYIEDTKKLLGTIDSAIQSGDLEKLEFHSHTLGSSAAAHGNDALHRLARRVENLCREENHKQALKMSHHLGQLGEKSLMQLEERIKTGF